MSPQRTLNPPPNPTPHDIYKILPPHPAPPTPLPLSLPLSSLDARDNFIHLSTSSQILGTLNQFFADVTHVWILKVVYERVEGRILWEESKKVNVEDGGMGEGQRKRDVDEDGDVDADGTPDAWSYMERRNVFPHLHGRELKLGRDEVDAVGKWERKDGSIWHVSGWPFDADMPNSE